MSDKIDIEDKFNLEDKKEKENQIVTIKKYCTIHHDTEIDFQCPICKKYYCTNCKKILKENSRGMQKLICKSCWKIFWLKSFIFISTLLLSIYPIIYFIQNKI